MDEDRDGEDPQEVPCLQGPFWDTNMSRDDVVFGIQCMSIVMGHNVAIRASSSKYLSAVCSTSDEYKKKQNRRGEEEQPVVNTMNGTQREARPSEPVVSQPVARRKCPFHLFFARDGDKWQLHEKKGRPNTVVTSCGIISCDALCRRRSFVEEDAKNQ